MEVRGCSSTPGILLVNIAVTVTSQVDRFGWHWQFTSNQKGIVACYSFSLYQVAYDVAKFTIGASKLSIYFKANNLSHNKVKKVVLSVMTFKRWTKDEIQTETETVRSGKYL